jgi:hypothetical protein
LRAGSLCVRERRGRLLPLTSHCCAPARACGLSITSRQPFGKPLRAGSAGPQVGTRAEQMFARFMRETGDFVESLRRKSSHSAQGQTGRAVRHHVANRRRRASLARVARIACPCMSGGAVLPQAALYLNAPSVACDS